MLRAAGFFPSVGSKHTQWIKGSIAVGLRNGGSLKTDEEIAVKRKIRQAERRS